MYMYVYVYIYNICMYIFNIYTALCILKISSESLLADTAPLPSYIKKKKKPLTACPGECKKTKKIIKRHMNVASHWVHRIHKLK